MKHTKGQIEVVCGSMFSGKTEELIRRVRRALIAKQKVQAFKPALDDRYVADEIVSHNGDSVKAIPLNTATRILELVENETTVVAVDEAQFFDDSIIAVIEELADSGVRVIVAGLDTDFRGEPFGSMPDIMARAEELTKLRAICTKCGNEASRTQRIVNGDPAYYDDPIILVGATESYEARCRECHKVPVREALTES